MGLALWIFGSLLTAVVVANMPSGARKSPATETRLGGRVKAVSCRGACAEMSPMGFI
jgi:hypothetical protein